MIETEKSRERHRQEIIQQAMRTGKFAPQPEVIDAKSERRRRNRERRRRLKKHSRPNRNRLRQRRR